MNVPFISIYNSKTNQFIFRIPLQVVTQRAFILSPLILTNDSKTLIRRNLKRSYQNYTCN